MQGTYLLILRMDQDLPGLAVGRLGCFDVGAGYYVYVGSAHGSGGLAARLRYHQQQAKQRPHWHIDHLRAVATLVETWAIGSPLPLEEPLALALQSQMDLRLAVPRFGAGDTGGPGHLFACARRPSPTMLLPAVLESFRRAGAEPIDFMLEITLLEESRP